MVVAINKCDKYGVDVVSYEFPHADCTPDLLFYNFCVVRSLSLSYCVRNNVLWITYHT